MNIVILADAFVFNQYKVFIHGLWKYNSEPINLYCIYHSLMNINLDAMKRVIEKNGYDNITLVPLYIPHSWDFGEKDKLGQFISSVCDFRKKIKEKVPSDFQTFPFFNELYSSSPPYLPYILNVWYKYFIPEIMPKEIDKVLALDVDLLIRGSLRPLYDIDLKGNSIAASTHLLLSNEQFASTASQLRIDRFNAGVMLYDLDKIRNDPTDKKLIDYVDDVVNNVTSELWHEQVAQNVRFHNKILLLNQPCIWNFFSHYNKDMFVWNIDPNIPYICELTERDFKDVVIIHYIGSYDLMANIPKKLYDLKESDYGWTETQELIEKRLFLIDGWTQCLNSYQYKLYLNECKEAGVEPYKLRGVWNEEE